MENTMIIRLYTVYDAKAEAYLQPYFSPTDAVAVRNFKAACNDQDHGFHAHAEDYSLFAIGAFDQLSGELSVEKALKPLARAHELLESPITVFDLPSAKEA